MEAAGVGLPVRLFGCGIAAALLGRAAISFLGLTDGLQAVQDFRIGHPFRLEPFNQAVDLVDGHFFHVLPPFVRGWLPLPYKLIIHDIRELVNSIYKYFL